MSRELSNIYETCVLNQNHRITPGIAGRNPQSLQFLHEENKLERQVFNQIHNILQQLAPEPPKPQITTQSKALPQVSYEQAIRELIDMAQ